MIHIVLYNCKGAKSNYLAIVFLKINRGNTRKRCIHAL